MALADNLAAYWKFDESSGDASDATGNGYTLTNNGTISYTTGLINNGGDLGSANSSKYFYLASDLGINATAALSISVWFKVATAPTSGQVQSIFFKRFENGTADSEYQMIYWNDGGTKKIRWLRFGSTNFSQTYNVDLGTGSWTHVVLTYDGTNCEGYLNGVSRATGTSTGTTSLSVTTDIIIGQYGLTSASWLKGIVEECGVWSRELTAAEVTELYNSGAGLSYADITGGGGDIFLPHATWFM